MLIGHGIVNLRVPDYPRTAPRERPHFRKKPAAAGSFHSVKAAAGAVCLNAYLMLRIHCTMVLMSWSFTWALGVIGMSPHAPLPPSFTFLERFASANLSLR
jgi:hypothetical protein